VQRDSKLEHTSIGLQALCRGKLARLNHNQVLESHKANEATICKLQAVCRTRLARSKHLNTLNQTQTQAPVVQNLQALCRRKIARAQYKEIITATEAQAPKVELLQALCRRKIARAQYKEVLSVTEAQAPKIELLQALCRRKIARAQYKQTLTEVETNLPKIQSLQALCRRNIARSKYTQKVATVKNLASENDVVQRLQAQIRSKLAQNKFTSLLGDIREKEPVIMNLQALSRGFIARKHKKEQGSKLNEVNSSLIGIQALARSKLAQHKLNGVKNSLAPHVASIEKLQALCRGSANRKQYQANIQTIKSNNEAVIPIQALSRRLLAKRHLENVKSSLKPCGAEIEKLQAIARGILTRQHWTHLLSELAAHDNSLSNLQALARGVLYRRYMAERMKYFEKNEDTVVMIQSIFRAKQAKRAYYDLAMRENPPVSTMRNFLYLLDDSESDFMAEMDLEQLRQKVVKNIRDNKKLEKDLSDMEIKIALLLKNRITLDEVLKANRSANSGKRGSIFGDSTSFAASSSASNLSLVSSGGFSLKGLDRESRTRLRNYQNLFYLLQTNPSYIAKLLVYNKNTLGEKSKKLMETIVLTVFGFAQNIREEYLLLKVFKHCIQEEINSVDKIEQFLRGNPVFIQMAVHYNRGAKERKYLRELLQPLVKKILNDPKLNLEMDPIWIYQGLIKEEESRTGIKSEKPFNVNLSQALSDPETKAAFILHLQQLRSLTAEVVSSILNSLDYMPYGVRYIAKELKLALMKKFPEEKENIIIKVVGHLVYYRYINPAIVAPELFDVIETVITPVQRKNLAEVAKMLNQISMGKMLKDEIFLQPLNNFIAFTAEKFAGYFYSVTEVVEPEIHFEINEYQDVSTLRKPTIYITYNEIITLHQMLFDNQDILITSNNDNLKLILDDLKVPPQLMDFNNKTLEQEITLNLTDRFATSDTAQEGHQLFIQAKRQIVYIIRVQSGASLLEILTKPAGPEEEDRYQALLTQPNTHLAPPVNSPDSLLSTPELPTNTSSPSESTLSLPTPKEDPIADLRQMTFYQLKAEALHNMIELEKHELVKREDGYQSMINSIAMDIKNKHQRQFTRSREFVQLRQTLANLQETSKFLDGQKASFQTVISQCIANLRAGKGKKHKVTPFSRQYFHMKGLERAGKMPKFGSYKYGADVLYKRGILISIDGYNPNKFDKITLTISSDQESVFRVEAYLLGVKMPNAEIDLHIEDLLQSQFDNAQAMSLFDGVVKVNVNLLIFLINKK
jgi:Ras GTPase-activating-like protein IQGAP2/3